MKIHAISDVHGNESAANFATGGDILIVAGDICPDGIETQGNFLFRFLWNVSKRYGKVIYIAGNHDFYMQTYLFKSDMKTLPKNAIYLEDESCEINGVKFYGTPWVPKLHRWAFYDNGQDKFQRIPEDIDILISHGPPTGPSSTGDYCANVGSEFLTNAIKRVSPKYVFCGHIHSASDDVIGESEILNCSVLDETYSVKKDWKIREINL